MILGKINITTQFNSSIRNGCALHSY
jgi:hypothetical protein